MLSTLSSHCCPLWVTCLAWCVRIGVALGCDCGRQIFFCFLHCICNALLWCNCHLFMRSTHMNIVNGLCRDVVGSWPLVGDIRQLWTNGALQSCHVLLFVSEMTCNVSSGSLNPTILYLNTNRKPYPIHSLVLPPSMTHNLESGSHFWNSGAFCRVSPASCLCNQHSATVTACW